MNLAASHLRNGAHKLEDMVDECEDYVNTLRNMAIEVHMLLSYEYSYLSIG